MIEIYEQIISKNFTLEENSIKIKDEKGYENLQKYVLHKRIERNQNLIDKVKKNLGYTCMACEINFQKTYGDLGKEFIEAHHTKSISSLMKSGIKGIYLDPKKDFIVLCSNCHRMIHKLNDSSNLTMLIQIINENR